MAITTNSSMRANVERHLKDAVCLAVARFVTIQ